MVKATSLPARKAAAKKKFNEAVHAIERELAGRGAVERNGTNRFERQCAITPRTPAESVRW
jgi:hypothetical protein